MIIKLPVMSWFEKLRTINSIYNTMVEVNIIPYGSRKYVWSWVIKLLLLEGKFKDPIIFSFPITFFISFWPDLAHYFSYPVSSFLDS